MRTACRNKGRRYDLSTATVAEETPALSLDGRFVAYTAVQKIAPRSFCGIPARVLRQVANPIQLFSRRQPMHFRRTTKATRLP